METINSKPKVYVTRQILPAAIEMLQERCEVISWSGEYTAPREILLKEIKTVDALYCTITDKIDEELLSHGKNLKVISTMSDGYDHINLAACRRRGILVGHTPDVQTEACAEFAMAVILCTTRRVIEANKQVHTREWKDWVPMYMCGRGIAGSVVGIVGMGRVGTSIVEKMLPFHPRELLYHNRKPNRNAPSAAVYVETLDELLIRSDFIISCLPFTADTLHLFDKEKFALMKTTAQFFNFGRGALVDQDGLYNALVSGKLHAAGVDVCTPEPLPTDHKLLTLPNFILLPHISSATLETRSQMASLAAQNIIAGLEGRALLAPVFTKNFVGCSSVKSG